MRTHSTRLMRVAVVAVVMTALALVTASGAGAAGPPVGLDLTGSGTSHVSYEYGGWRGEVTVEVSGQFTPGGPAVGTLASDYVFMSSDPSAPNSYVLTLRGGTITGRITELYPNVNTTTQIGDVTGVVEVQGGTGRFARFTGGTLEISYHQVWRQPAAGFPGGNTDLSNYRITGTLTS